MNQDAFQQLSEYQRAILTEMDVSLWVLNNSDTQADEGVQQPVQQQNQQFTQAKAVAAQGPKSAQTSKEDALARLQQLKGDKPGNTSNQSATTTTTEPSATATATDELLIVLGKADIPAVFINDVLISLGLDEKTQKPISEAQLEQYTGAPLVWKQGEIIAMEGHQLTTPHFSELTKPGNKKKLWQQLQSM